jgi:hypothetical protein
MFGPIMDGMYNTRLEFLFDGILEMDALSSSSFNSIQETSWMQ